MYKSSFTDNQGHMLAICTATISTSSSFCISSDFICIAVKESIPFQTASIILVC